MIKMQEIMEMSVVERIILVEKNWDSIDPDYIPIPEAHERELERRLERYENDETTFFSWDEIKNELHRAMF